jgi:hypothetical protein
VEPMPRVSSSGWGKIDNNFKPSVILPPVTISQC